MVFLVIAFLYAFMAATTCRFVLRRFYPDAGSRERRGVFPAVFCSVLWPLFWLCYAVMNVVGGRR